jgi:hypothetical protein
MVPDLLNYKVSFLNPLLKIIIPLLFLTAAYFLYNARAKYQGELGIVVRRMIAACIMGVLANLFRLGADFSAFLTDLKWGESLMFMLFGLVSVYAVWPLLTFMSRMAKMKQDAE